VVSYQAAGLGNSWELEQQIKDAGTITVLMLRLKETRLPRAKKLLEKVNNGEKLSDRDIQFLKTVHEDSLNIYALIKRHPEVQELYSCVFDLYVEIITKGLENESPGSENKLPCSNN
jgi:hypothetical protein